MANKKKTKKKVAAKPQQQMSPKNYILTGRARKLPIVECWINSNWRETGMNTLIVARQHGTGNITFGLYLVDTYCLGLKDTSVRFSAPRFEYEETLNQTILIHEADKEQIDYVLAHNIIYGAIAYAEDLGMKPHKDWATSQFVLEEDTEDIPLVDVTFGKDGKPFYINGPFDKVDSVIAKLDKSVGKGNYVFLYMMGDQMDDTGFYQADDDDDFDDDEDFDDDDDVEDAEYEQVK